VGAKRTIMVHDAGADEWQQNMGRPEADQQLRL
jgi:hypothetical protein